MELKPVRIIQISDMHVQADNKPLLGVNTTESLQAIIDYIKAEAREPDLMLLTGDMSQDESKASYIKIASLVKVLAVPAYYVPGNHDDSLVMATVYPRDTMVEHKQIVLEKWQLILLDTHKPAMVEGYLAASELDYLEQCLKAYPEHYAIVVCHHHPVSVGSVWMDKIGIQDPDQLWQVLAAYPQVKSILFGHVHHEYEGEKQGIRYLSAPSTCFQFKPQSAEFGLDNLPQGYRWLELYADGQLESGVTRLPEYVGRFEEQVEGY
jgi:Icc protein